MYGPNCVRFGIGFLAKTPSSEMIKSIINSSLCDLRGSKLLGFRMSGTPNNGDRNPNLGAGFFDRKPRDCEVDGQHYTWVF